MINLNPQEHVAALRIARRLNEKGDPAAAVFYRAAHLARPRPYRGAHTCGDMSGRVHLGTDGCPACYLQAIQGAGDAPYQRQPRWEILRAADEIRRAVAEAKAPAPSGGIPGAPRRGAARAAVRFAAALDVSPSQRASRFREAFRLATDGIPIPR